MAKAESFQDLSLQPPETGGDLWRWLYGELRAAVLDGRLKPGSRLPSSRSLAQQYGLSRGTVTVAFEQLRAEGYTQSQVGAGTYVATELPERQMLAGRHRSPVVLPPSTAQVAQRALRNIEEVKLLPPSRVLGPAFRTYEPAVDQFPANLWARVAGRVLRRAPRSLYGQGDPGGYGLLRKAIAEYVGSARGVRCTPRQVLVTSGAQQGLDLVARVLLDPGDQAWVEDPCYPGARQTLRAAGADVVAVPVDADGLHVAWGRRTAPCARLAYVTPANQFPTGALMSLERRLALLEWASSAGAWIIEDEYDAEYRYFGHPVAALQSLDRSGAVIYVGTFTKMLFNALRLGFLVLPERVVDVFERTRTFLDRHPPTLDQAILAEFILEGHFGHHVRRMRQLYAERMETLVDAAHAKLAGRLDVRRAPSGMRTVGWLARGERDAEIAARCREAGLELHALSEFRVDHPQPPGLILGFAGCEAGELRRGVDLLAKTLTVGS